jgi:DNA-3-methyladenine glycosylase I
MPVRCSWSETHPLHIAYHDVEWGVPVHDDRALFEMLNLEGAQAGLSWLTILQKRANYRAAFDNFDAERIAHYDQAKIDALVQDAGIVRHRQKISAVVGNARTMLAVREEFGTFASYIWQWVNNKPLQRDQAALAQQVSVGLSKDLHRRGFRFVGPTIMYAFMQAVGMINDHEPTCFRAEEVRNLRQRSTD